MQKWPQYYYWRCPQRCLHSVCVLCVLQVSCLKKALGQYQWVIEYHDQHSDEVDDVFGEEVKVCKEMVELLPIRIATLSKH